MRKGTTYIVRPFIAPANSGDSLSRASPGDIQLLFGPASSLFFVQTNVRCSVRATSCGGRAVQVAAGQLLLVELDELSRRQALLGELRALGLGAVAPDHAVGRRELFDLVYPLLDRRMMS